MAISRFQQLDIFMCHRSAGGIQKYIKPDCNLDSYMTSLVLMAAYSAFLISSLAVQRQDLPFRDFQGLLHDGSYRLGVLRDSYEFNIFDVCGRKYLWPDYLVLVVLGLCEKFLRGGNMRYQSCFIRRFRQSKLRF